MTTVKTLKDVDDRITVLSDSIESIKTDITNQLDTFKTSLDQRDAAGIADLKNFITKSLGDIETKLDDTKETLNKNVQDVEKSLSDKFNAFQQTVNDDLLKIREIHVDRLVKDNKNLRKRVRVLEKRMATHERQTNENEQNNRKSNCELSGIPANVKDEDLAPLVAKIMAIVLADTFEITEADIEACHRLPGKSNPKVTIVRMKRNHLFEARLKKKKLKDVPAALNLPEGTKIFLNDNLSKNMKSLAYNARLLKSEGLIADCWFFNAAVRLKLNDETIVKVTHELDLYKRFAQFQGFTFDTDFCDRVLEDDIEDYDDLDGNEDDDE